MPKIAEKQVVDYKLTRYACYLIVQNGDPRKEIIALGQTDFAIQTMPETHEFFKIVQSKLHYAISGNTASEIILDHAC
ncbi:MAG: virulence RhuM family protein [Nitrososphaerota archaeon]|nr:virulence RhuM family protein [Nitrososphaerota archaeon]